MKEKFKDTKGVIRSRKSKKGRDNTKVKRSKGQKDKQWSIKYYTGN